MRVDDEFVGADAVIAAAGAWSPHLLEPICVKVRIAPQRGQIRHLRLPGVKHCRSPPNRQTSHMWRPASGSTRWDPMSGRCSARCRRSDYFARTGVPAAKSRIYIDLIALDAATAVRLGVPEGQAVIRLRRLTWLTDGRLAEARWDISARTPSRSTSNRPFSPLRTPRPRPADQHGLASSPGLPSVPPCLCTATVMPGLLRARIHLWRRSTHRPRRDRLPVRVVRLRLRGLRAGRFPPADAACRWPHRGNPEDLLADFRPRHLIGRTELPHLRPARFAGLQR
ncbi:MULTISPECIES: UTRA domain-containing protein [unclassified Streptomyces]|uniref:UTRA domain-containing protein n=1 Tax=unclassified Streptomyces TaxID=2593676 RepID=UPI002B1CB4C7|nr:MULTISPECIES: UTRA domain-containing protein [unclassified Streptomyces]